MIRSEERSFSASLRTHQTSVTQHINHTGDRKYEVFIQMKDELFNAVCLFCSDLDEEVAVPSGASAG